MFIFLMRARAIIESLRLALAVCLALVTVETVFRAAKKAARRGSRRAAGRSFRLADGFAPSPPCVDKPSPNQQRPRPRPQLPALRLRSMRASATTPPSRLLRALLA